MSPPYRTSTRVPDDLPFVLRAGPVARVLLLVAFLAPAAISVIVAVMVGADIGADPAFDVPMAAIALVAALVGLLSWRFSVVVRLAADEDGVWVCARRWPVLAVRLPWDDVSLVDRTSPGSSRPAIRVVPRYPEAGRGLGVLADTQQAWNRLLFDSSLVARVPAGTGVSAALGGLARLADAHAARHPTATVTELRHRLDGLADGYPTAVRPADPRPTDAVPGAAPAASSVDMPD
ncbi:MAG: hypothetical protein WCA46_05355, partial [Actinocatenispora sp.]